MGLRGPAPKPTAIRKLEGNPSGRPYNQREPRYSSTLPRKPKRISTKADKVWDELVDEMAPAGVLTPVDKRALWQLSEDEAILVELYDGIWKMSALLAEKAKAQGKPLPAGALAALLNTEGGRGAMKALAQIADRTIKERAQFGLTPSSRTKVMATVSGVIDSLEAKLCG